MKTLSVALTFCFLIISFNLTQAAYIDSTYVYSTFHSADSSRVYIVAQLHFGSQPCELNNVSSIDEQNETTIKACYELGALGSICYRTDTFDLGIRANTFNKATIVVATTNNACNAFLDTAQVDVDINYNTTSTIADPMIGVVLYPNPISDQLNICWESNRNGVMDVQTLDGRLILHNIPITKKLTQLSTAEWIPDIYIAIFRDDKNKKVLKFHKSN